MSLNDVINQYGGKIKNDLNMVLNQINEDDPEGLLSYPTTKYVNIDSLKSHLTSSKNFNILSINIQSLNAKFNEFMLLLNDLSSNDTELGAICIQETWLDDANSITDTRPLSINGYNLITQGKRCSKHGGLGIYIKDQYQSIIIIL